MNADVTKPVCGECFGTGRDAVRTACLHGMNGTGYVECQRCQGTGVDRPPSVDDGLFMEGYSESDIASHSQPN